MKQELYFLYSSEVFMRMETVIFLVEFQKIWPLTSTAEGLYSELCLGTE